jgi:flagellar hook-associated protein 3 FlgL
MNSLTVGSALAVQSQYAQAETQQASGLVASDFATLGGANSSEMLNLEDGIAQSQTWASDATTVGSRTQGMYTALGNIVTTVTSLETKISAASSAADNSTLLSAAQEIQKSLVTEMNEQESGSYLFAGSNTGTAPVDLTNYQTTSSSGSGTNQAYNYYTGNSDVQSVRVSSQQTVDYGVTANSPGFEEALRATQAVIDAASGTITQSTATVTDPTAASTSVASGDALSINGVSVTISTANESLNDIATQINSAASAASSAVSAKVVYNGSAYVLQVSSGSSTDLTISGTAATTLGLSSTTNTASLQSTLKSALGVATSAVTDLANTQETVSAKSAELTTAEQQQTTYVTYLQNSLSSVKDVDTAQTAAKVSQYQTQLQASYLAVAQISKVSLTQYL